MARRRIPDVPKQLCKDCRHAIPVTHEHLDHVGNPIFCQCQFYKHYNFLNYREAVRANCPHYDAKRGSDEV